MKTKKLILLTLGLLLCATQGFATQYCDTELTSSTGWIGKYKFSAEKLSSTQIKFTVKAIGDEIITGFYQLQLRDLGSGTTNKTTWDPNDADFSDGSKFSVSGDGKTATIFTTWTKYPTSNIRIYLIMRRDNSDIHGKGSDIYGQEISDIDCSATCSGGGGSVAVESISLKESTTLSVGGNETLTATVLPADATNKNIIWSSSDSNIASVAGGVVTAKAVGSATITATSEADGTKSATCTVTVTAAPAPSTACSGTSKEASQESFTTGYNYKFSTEGTTVNIEFELLDDKTGVVAYLWKRTPTFQEIGMSVSDKKATISLTNQTIGQSITFACKFAYSNGMAVTKDFTYTVGDNCSSLTKSDLTRTSDASVTLTQKNATSTITHTTTSIGAITYESSDTKVATVDNGVITAVANGDATITVSQAADATYEAGSFTVNVTVAIAVTGVTLDQSTATLYLGGSDASKTTTLVPTVSPNDAADKSVSWSSSNSSIASVDAGVVTAVGKGNANIIVKTTDGNKTCTCVVTVKQYVTNIELNKSSMTLKKDAQETLTAQVSPENADDKSITWSSSDDAIATVSNGVVTAKSSGTATITATANDGSGVKATCTVTVPVPVTGVSLNKTATSLYVSESETLTATVEPSDAADKSVSWSTSDDKVATVSAGGMVTAVANGTAVITATSNDDNTKLATCTVTVSMYVAPIYVAQTTITDSKTSTNYTMNYSIAHNLNGTLTYTITLDGYLKDLNPQIHVKIGGEVVQLSGYTSDHPSATGTTTNTYSKDEQQTGKFYFAYADGGLIEQNFSYTVGADNTSCGTCFKVTF